MLEMNSSYLHVLNRICEEVQKDMANKGKKENEIDWDVNVEVLFFYAMIGHKPVGVNRHFMMLLIHNKFSTYLNHQISSKVIWDHLDSMYDMAALHESEIIPFPNDEVDYELPEDCHELLEHKYGVSLKRSSSENESTKSSSTSKSSKKPGTTKLKQSSVLITTSKSNFAVPTFSKSSKNQTLIKNENKTQSSDVPLKVKQESGSSVKVNKIKHSSNPFSNKPAKCELPSVAKDDSSDISSNKKNRVERGSSPAINKKSIKTESGLTNSTTKKPAKSESAANGSKLVKVETTDNNMKKVKVDKEFQNKKGKLVSSADNVSLTKKKVENSNGVKKKNESDCSIKREKTSDSSSTKQIKTDIKGSNQSSKVVETETSSSSGSRKSSPVVKVKSHENAKKVRRPKMEESTKKSSAGPKRRRQ